MTIIKLNLKGSKYASTPYASHLDLSLKIQFEDAQRGLFVCVPPPHTHTITRDLAQVIQRSNMCFVNTSLRQLIGG